MILMITFISYSHVPRPKNRLKVTSNIQLLSVEYILYLIYMTESAFQVAVIRMASVHSPWYNLCTVQKHSGIDVSCRAKYWVTTSPNIPEQHVVTKPTAYKGKISTYLREDKRKCSTVSNCHAHKYLIEELSPEHDRCVLERHIARIFWPNIFPISYSESMSSF